MADAAVFTSDNQLFVFNAIPMNLDRAEGTYFTLAYDVPDRTVTVSGVDGDGYYNTTKNLKGTMTLVVLPHGESNDILAAALKAQEAADAVGTPIKFGFLAQRGTAIYTGFCRIAGEPALEYSNVGTTNSWKLVSTRIYGKQGGMPSAVVAPPA